MDQIISSALAGNFYSSTQVRAGILNINNKQIELPVKDGTIGPSALDIGKLYAQTGMFTYDPGFTSTAS
jgi:hypothetical protein